MTGGHKDYYPKDLFIRCTLFASVEDFNGGQPLLEEVKKKEKKNGNKNKLILDIVAQCLHPLVVVEVVMQFLKNCLITIKCAGVLDNVKLQCFFLLAFSCLLNRRNDYYIISQFKHTHI